MACRRSLHGHDDEPISSKGTTHLCYIGGLLSEAAAAVLVAAGTGCVR